MAEIVVQTNKGEVLLRLGFSAADRPEDIQDDAEVFNAIVKAMEIETRRRR
ncbi:MAG TPA: hypothetical protein VGT02_09805 [Methylomirabilota bacterium]|jgi:hypothetical protein|nr:hypothetical protein [Methylomirabilota bacterium]